MNGLENRTEQVAPVKEGLWEIVDQKPQLVGDTCEVCGEIFFPPKVIKFCAHCHSRQLKKMLLSREGAIKNFTIVYQRPAGGFYNGPVPFTYGVVELPEKVWIQTLFAGCDLETLRAGMPVCLVVEGISKEEDGGMLTYKFVPFKAKEGGQANEQ